MIRVQRHKTPILLNDIFFQYFHFLGVSPSLGISHPTHVAKQETNSGEI